MLHFLFIFQKKSSVYLRNICRDLKSTPFGLCSFPSDDHPSKCVVFANIKSAFFNHVSRLLTFSFSFINSVIFAKNLNISKIYQKSILRSPNPECGSRIKGVFRKP